MEYKFSSRMVALSHLSDAQELISMGLYPKANRCINFAKLILIKWKEDTEVTEKELNELWNTHILKK